MPHVYTLPDTILSSAHQYPNKEAFRCDGKAVSFAEMVAIMNQIAYFLHDCGLNKGEKVGVYLPRSLHTALAVYGIMHAGGVYVPLDPDAPISRIQHLIRDCGIKILITNPFKRRAIPKLLEGFDELTHIIGIKRETLSVPTCSWEEIQTLPETFPKSRVQAQDLAYIMYTSGSTGAPKGIMHTHYSGLSYAKLSQDLYELGSEDIIGNHSPLHFDISTMGYFTAPLAGSTAVIISDAYTKMPASLSQLIEKERLTLWYSVPLALIQILNRGVMEERDFSSLRWVLFGGEPFPTKHLRELMEKIPQATFCNVYGPAEVNQCTYYHLPHPPTDHTPIPIGHIWPNTEGLIVDKDGQEVQQGDIGELLIKSATRMQGYWNNPELTDRSFYKRNTTGIEEIYFKTGDLVRENEEGLLEFLGRKDRQIKVRGYRVELDEIESYLYEHPAVQEVAVFATQGKGNNKQIEAIVIPKTGHTFTLEELKSHLTKRLPPYAVPTKISTTDTFPRTSTGKINYIQLAQQQQLI